MAEDGDAADSAHHDLSVGANVREAGVQRGKRQQQEGRRALVSAALVLGGLRLWREEGSETCQAENEKR